MPHAADQSRMVCSDNAINSAWPALGTRPRDFARSGSGRSRDSRRRHRCISREPGAQHRPAPETRSSAVPAPGHRTRSRRASRNRRWHFAEAVRSGGVMLCHDAERTPPRWPRLLPPSRSPITPGLSVTTVPADARSLRSPVHVPPEPLTSATPPRCSCVQPRMVAAISRISSLLQAPILQRAGSGSRFRGNLDSGSDLDARRRSKKWRIAGDSAKRYCHWSGCGLGTLLCTSFSFSSLHTFPVTRANM